METKRPGTPTENALTKIWESLLDVQSIDLDDYFFDLGGNSLIAVRLFADIERSFGIRLPLSTLFQSPTIRTLAAEIDRPVKADAWSTLVPIHSRGTLPPFFCVHAVGANVLNYRLLAQHMGDEQPFYGFQAQGLDGSKPALNTVEEMAAQYVREVRGIQPHGPYFLGGGSTGGTVAFEMAQQLTAQGEGVDLLALLDTALKPHQMPMRLQPKSPLHQRLRILDTQLASLFELPLKDQFRFLAGTVLKKVSAILRKRSGLGEGRSTDSSSELIAGLRATILAAIDSYQPQPYTGALAVFLTEEVQSRTRLDPRLMWFEYAKGGMEVCIIPGSHVNFLDEPHVITVAKQLRSAILRRVATDTNSHHT